MGNYISCALSSPSSRNSNAAKVIFPDGETRQFNQPTNAAELMLETPNHFLVNSQSLHIGRRFSALSADEELEIGNVYVMFAMGRLNSVITTADMGRLLMAANSAVRRATGGKPGILLGFNEEAQAPPAEENKRGEGEGGSLKLEEIEDESIRELKRRLSLCRSRRPFLETIAEESICSR